MADLRVGMIGAGNVAWNLVHALQSAACSVEQVISPKSTSAEALAAAFNIPVASGNPSELLPDLDLVFILTNDHAIAGIAEDYLPYRSPGTIFVHASGSMPLSALARLGDPIGVFYPLQTFTRNHLADFRAIPIFLEGSEAVLKVLRPLAGQISGRVSDLNSEDRLRMHLGAVFVSNFVNFMLLLGEETVDPAKGLDLSVYEPLVRECIDKAFRYGPRQAQTGPARRGDQITMDKHLQILEKEDPERAELYRSLSAMIGKRFGQG